jgi:hypothetical protein
MVAGMLRGEKLRNQLKTGEFGIRDRHTSKRPDRFAVTPRLITPTSPLVRSDPS